MEKNNPIKLSEAKSDRLKDKKKQKLYGAMWFDGKLNSSFDGVMIKRSKWQDGYSKNSYCFCGAGEIEVNYNSNEKDEKYITCEILKEIFLDKNNRENNEKAALFENKFIQACSGSGEEYLKIAKMHSSSLCALLFFYGVKEGKELVLNLEDKDHKFKDYIFTESVFEYKSPVIDSRYPSNMDVVLLGKEKDSGKNVALFLESKFSEYIDCQTQHGKRKDKKTGDYKGIDKGYLTNEFSKPLYRKDNLKKIGLDRKPVHEGEIDERIDDFELCVQEDEAFYIHGIKQMISHYVGVRNVMETLKTKDKKGLILDKKKKPDSQKIVNDFLDKKPKIILGEILFDFPEFEGKGMFEDERNRYADKYKELAAIINKINKEDSQFEMLTEPLKYSKIMRFAEDAGILDKNVKEYYRIK